MNSKTQAVLLAFSQKVDRINQVIGKCCAWAIFGMMLIVVLVVFFRYFFLVGSVLWQEVVIWLHGISLMLGISYTMQKDAHVRIDFLYDQIGMEYRLYINVLGHLFFLLPFCFCLMVLSIDDVMRSWGMGERSGEMNGMPYVFLFKSVIPIAGGLLMLQSLSDLIKLLLKRVGV